jgi:MFS transporter, LPLT family, lysophospholipid transporter
MKPNRNYLFLLASQFLGAFGDNMMLAIILGPLTFLRAAGKITEQQVDSANAFYSVLFFLPFVLLAPLAGFLNDRFPKTTWLFGGNLIKLSGVGVGALGLWWHRDWQPLGYCLMGIGACCYSPAKYGVLPEILPRERLVKANGSVEMLTLAAILTGLWAGATLVDHLPVLTCYAVGLAVYGFSLVCNSMMERTPCNLEATLGTSANEFFRNLKKLLTHARLGRVLFGTGLFWLCGATLRTNLQGWGLAVLKGAPHAHITNEDLALLKIWLAVGIIIGSLLAGQLHRVGDLRWTRGYGWMMALFILPMGFVTGGTRFLIVVAVLMLSGISAGLFLIPLNAALQAESDHAKLGKTIATQNFIDYLAMLIGAGFVLALSHSGLTAAQIFIALAGVLVLVVFALRIPPLAPATAPRENP